MRSVKILGYTINLSKGAGKPEAISNTGRKKASSVIRKQNKREVSFQIADIRTALVMAENPQNPDRSKLHQIYRYILRDARLKSQIRDAIMKVQCEPFMLYAHDSDKADETLSTRYRKKWLNDSIKYAVESEMHGYGVVEYDQIDAKAADIGVVNRLDHEYVSIEKQCILIDASVNGSYLSYADIATDIDLVEFCDSRNDYGILLECAYNVIWKYYSRTDWSRTSEKWGNPLLKVLVDTNSDTELDDYEARASNFGSDGYIIGQKGDDIGMLERSGQRMHDIFYDNIKLCNEEFTLLVNGQVATSSQKSFVGSAEVQERNFEDLTLSRLQRVADMVNLKLFPYLRLKGFTDLENVRFDYPALIQERKKKLSRSFENQPAKDAKDTDKEPTDEQ
ncbi:phage portal protein family protein [Pinibacter soli]|uniref:Phage portal protein n=1 Tax=Pinibacter soli TaxID=3044211 RepID=A0ABT6RB57_9BACT|nr:hypothetical protein [Pinibacter soli]MDI3319139.1 hypothetical protein [Pinibacter soli]